MNARDPGSKNNEQDEKTLSVAQETSPITIHAYQQHKKNKLVSTVVRSGLLWTIDRSRNASARPPAFIGIVLVACPRIKPSSL